MQIKDKCSEDVRADKMHESKRMIKKLYRNNKNIITMILRSLLSLTGILLCIFIFIKDRIEITIGIKIYG